MRFLITIFLLASINMGAYNFDTVIQEHIQKLSNLDKVNSKLLILFSATAGMGKTMLANKIEAEMQAIKVTVDDARILLKKNKIYPIEGSEQDKINCITSYLDHLISKLEQVSKNQLIIIDDSVDRLYQNFMSIAKAHKFPTYLIRIKVSKEKAIERIKKREQSPQGYLENMDRWYRDYERLNSGYIDYVIDNESDKFDNGVLSGLISNLKSASTKKY